MESLDCCSLTPTRRDRRRAETRERLVEAALGLFAELGFENVTVEMITDRADLGKGTFFNYFAGKEAVVESYFRLQGEAAGESILQAEENSAGAIWDRIVNSVHLIAERDGRTKPLARTILGLTLTNEHVRAASQQALQAVLAFALPVVERAQQAGELRPDLTPGALAENLASCYFSVLRDWACDFTERSLHDEIDYRFRILRQGLAPRESMSEGGGRA